MVRNHSYLDFDLSVEPDGRGGYRARVLKSPAGETSPEAITIPFSDLEVENFLLKVGRPRRQSTRGGRAPETVAVQEFGSTLFDAVFKDRVKNALDRSLDQVEATDNTGLRLRLRLSDCPELRDLPWEYLYNRERRRYFALSEWTPVVRYLELQGRIRPLAVHGPLRVLVMAASPTEFEPLNVDDEWQKLKGAVGDLQDSGHIVLDRVPSGTLADLRRMLRQQTYHVFHYIGHGRYDHDLQDGVLALEDATGHAHVVCGDEMGALLHDHKSLRLVILNSCEGARGGLADPYSGTAQSLVYQGIPAVVAMQFEISDKAAITFAHSLYEVVADGLPLDAAMSAARNAVRDQPNPIEWATPVLYLRTSDASIFNVVASGSSRSGVLRGDAGRSTEPGEVVTPEADGPDAPSSEAPSGKTTPTSRDPLYTRALSAFFNGRWNEAVDAFEQLTERYPEDSRYANKLAEARSQTRLAETYSNALSAWERSEWDLAAELWQRVSDLDSDYRDVQEYLEATRTRIEIVTLENEMLHLFESEDWSGAINVGARLSELGAGAQEELMVRAQESLVDEDLASKYGQALELLDDDEWVPARDLLVSIVHQNKDYRDVKDLIARIDTEVDRLAVGQLRAQMREAAAQDDWDAVLESSMAIARVDVRAADEIGLATRARGERPKPAPKPLTVEGSTCWAISPDSNCVATGGGRWLRVWRLADGHRLWDFKTSGVLNHVNDLSFSRGGDIAIVTTDSTVSVLRGSDGSLVGRVPVTVAATSLQYAGGADVLAVSSPTKVQIWDTLSNNALGELPHAMSRCAVRLSYGGDRLATLSDSSTVSIWDLRGSEPTEIASLEHQGTIHSLSFSPDARYIAVTELESAVVLWDVLAGTVLHRLSHESVVTGVQFSPVDSRLVTLGQDGSLVLWNGVSGARMGSLRRVRARDLRFDPAGSWVASIDTANSIEFSGVHAPKVSRPESVGELDEFSVRQGQDLGSKSVGHSAPPVSNPGPATESPGSPTEKNSPVVPAVETRKLLNRADLLKPEDVTNKRFNPTMFREGYDQDEVDDFLDEIVAELELRWLELNAGAAEINARRLNAPAVVEKRFNPTKYREGYDQDEVDDFLDEVVATLKSFSAFGIGPV